MISVKQLIRKRNGCGDLLDLDKHSMVRSKWDIIVNKAEYVLCNQVCNGRNLNYILPKHINTHCDAHGDINRSANNTPCGVSNKHICVNRLLNIIQTGYQRFIAAKTHIIGNVQLREDFELSADFLNLSAPANIPSSNTQSIRYLCVRE